jgi:hypothetical protein
MSQANLALSNLRGIVIVIVLAFHSSLAYLASVPTQSTRFDQAPYTWQAFPIVDTHRWIGFDVFCAWQDVSLMALMFFLSGLFVAPGPFAQRMLDLCHRPDLADRPSLRAGDSLTQSACSVSSL